MVILRQISIMVERPRDLDVAAHQELTMVETEELVFTAAAAVAQLVILAFSLVVMVAKALSLCSLTD
jgi:hypothetical protein